MSPKKNVTQKAAKQPAEKAEVAPPNSEGTEFVPSEPPKRFAILMLATLGLVGWLCFLGYVAFQVVFAPAN